jgi:RimJ/RimL family protein N-acetyltransferase
LVRLEPLTLDHADALVEAAGPDRSTYGFTFVPRNRQEAADYIEAGRGRRARGEQLPYAQIRMADDRLVGHTSLCTLRYRDGVAVPYAAEIGWTWLAPSAQRSGINTEAKLLLMTYAFETWRVARLDLKTDARNDRSRRAIERLGARFEGVLRNWQPSFVPGEEDGYRDSAIFSIVTAEWPVVKHHLQSLLGAGRR